MEKILKISYRICAAFMAALFLLVLFTSHDDVIDKRESGDFSIISDYEFKEYEDSSAPSGIRQEYTFKLDNLEYEALIAFYSVHQNIEIYLDDELEYRLENSEDTILGKTPGNQWNRLVVRSNDDGKTVKIVVKPVYKAVQTNRIDIYYGTSFAIFNDILTSEGKMFLLAIVAIIMGLIFIAYYLYVNKREKIEKNLWYMGCFAIGIGIWKITDSTIIIIIDPYSVVASLVPFIALNLIIVPFVLYIKELFVDNHYFLWYIPLWASVVCMAITIFLQITNILDMRESVVLNHGVMVIVVIITIIMLIRELVKYGLSKKLWIMILCLMTCLGGSMADMVLFYLYPDTNSVLGIIGLLIYIFVFGAESINETQKLIKKGKEAQKFEEIAYHDQMTGLLNRRSYSMFIQEESDSKSEICVVMCDLNNLKLCNDKYGHEEGDKLIIAAARIITDAFGRYGKCYRIGGDEFTVIIEEEKLDKIDLCIKKLNLLLERYNNDEENVYPLCIAYGSAVFDANEDQDISDTVRRADKEMYIRKMKMKA